MDPETEQIINLMQETPRKKKMILHEPVAVEDKIVEVARKQRKFIRGERTRAVKSPRRFLIEEMEADKEVDGERAVTTLKAPFVKPRKTVKKRHGEEILSKVCAIEVCKPEICCADLEGKLSFPATAQTSFRRVGKAIYFFIFYASHGTSWRDKIMRSPLEAQHDPIIPRFLSYAVLFEPAMAASCNFLSYLRQRGNEKYCGEQIDSAAKRKNTERR